MRCTTGTRQIGQRLRKPGLVPQEEQTIWPHWNAMFLQRSTHTGHRLASAAIRSARSAACSLACSAAARAAEICKRPPPPQPPDDKVG